MQIFFNLGVHVPEMPSPQIYIHISVYRKSSQGRPVREISLC